MKEYQARLIQGGMPTHGDPKPEWYLYMIRCRGGHLYTGIATDIKRRFSEHKANKGAKYLRGRGPLKLVFKKRIGSRRSALKIERLVKKLPKDIKEQLVKIGLGIEAILRESG